MKKILLLLSVILLQSTVSVVDAAKPTPRQKLIQRLAKIQKKGYMYAHQDDTFYGITWDWDQNRSDTRELVGDYPAVCGYDLGGLEMGDAKDLDSVPFSRIREDVIRQYEAGGIITFSWHPRNPLLGTTAWIQNDTTAYNQAVEALCKMRQCNVAKQVIDPKTTVKSVLPGGSQNAKYMQWLKRLADFMLTLKDKKGNQIPFIFRPFHENNGSWFWWGQKLCSDAEYHALWNMTQDYINSVVCSTDGSKLGDYLMWSYSPNLQGNWTEEEWLKRYPGDDRIDLIGEDAYQWGTEADYIKQLDADLAIISKIGREHGKLIAMTECGMQNSPVADWWQRVFKPIIEKYPICYFLPWRNYSKDHFGASPAAKTADDFKAWSKQKNFLFLNDIKKLK